MTTVTKPTTYSATTYSLCRHDD